MIIWSALQSLLPTYTNRRMLERARYTDRSGFPGSLLPYWLADHEANNVGQIPFKRLLARSYA